MSLVSDVISYIKRSIGLENIKSTDTEKLDNLKDSSVFQDYIKDKNTEDTEDSKGLLDDIWNEVLDIINDVKEKVQNEEDVNAAFAEYEEKAASLDGAKEDSAEGTKTENAEGTKTEDAKDTKTDMVNDPDEAAQDGKTQEGTTAKSNYSDSVQKLLDETYSKEEVIKALDVDGDGKLSEEEKQKFEDFIKDANGNLTEGLINNAYKDISEGKFSYEDLVPEIDGELNTDDSEAEAGETDDTEDSAKTDESEKSSGSSGSGGVRSSGGGGGVSGGGYSGAGVGGAAESDVEAANKDISSMSLDELKSYKSDLENQQNELQGSIDEKKGTLKQAEDNYNNVKNKEKENIEKAKGEFDEADKAYKEAMNNDEYLNSDAGKELKTNIEQNLADISKAEEDKSTKTQDLTQAIDARNEAYNKDIECLNNYTDAQSATAKAKGTLAAIESTLSSHFSGELDDEAKKAKAELEKKKAAAEKDVKEKEQAEQKAKKAFENADKDLDEKEAGVTTAKENLSKAEETLTALNKVKEDLDKQVEENCSQAVITAKKTYDEKKTALDTAMDTQIKDTTEAEEALKTQQDTLAEDVASMYQIKDQINQVDNKITQKETESQIKEEYNLGGNGKELLTNLEAAGGDAWNHFDKLANTLGMSVDDAASYIVELCEDPNFGNGSIDPVLFVAQLCQESMFNTNCVGDHGLAVGLGQLHECCVSEVSKLYGRNYKSSDRTDPKKNMEIAILYNRYWYEKTGSQAGALGCYNQGNQKSGLGAAGKKYLRDVLSRLNNYSLKS